MAAVQVEAFDGYGNSFCFLIDPGAAPVDAIADLFMAISDLHCACGGEGLTFRVIPPSDDKTVCEVAP